MTQYQYALESLRRMILQAADFIDRSGLEAQLEPLIKVAELHASGRQHYARSIASDLLQDFLAVEDRFAANKGHSEQEVIEALRLVSSYSSQVGEFILFKSCMSPAA